MSLVTYQMPDLNDLKSEIEKPQPLSGKSFPYNGLDDRRFEELLYSIYKTKLDTTGFSFDNISLMSGVRDKGRDCALTRNGIGTGLIQCKKYASPLSKQQFALEITKFVLYSIIDKKLLPDPEDFHYFIAPSSGFSLECSDFVDDFNRLAPLDADLYKWVAKNIQNPTLAGLEIQNVNPLVSGIFSKIKVRKILPQDLDIMLFEPVCLNLIPLFFNVLTVVDNSELIEIKKQLDRISNPEFDLEKIQNELQKGSSSLRIEKNEFDDIPDSHIEREETRLLYDWVTRPAETNQANQQLNICMLAANAGKGKTVILKDLYDVLTEQGIPVLGLKADKLQSTNLLDLQHKIGLSLPVVDFVDLCKVRSFINLFNTDFATINEFFTDNFWVSLLEEYTITNRAAGSAFTFNDLKERAKAKFVNVGYAFTSRVESRINEENLVLGLKNILTELCQYQVFFKGYLLKCNQCSSVFYYHLNEADETVRCKGCQQSFTMPVEPNFAYKLNDLIKNNIYRSKTERDGNLTVIRTLADIAAQSKRYFLFSPQINIFLSFRDRKPHTDIDIFCISDGKLIIGEAKHSSNGFFDRNSDGLNSLQVMANIAKIIRPDQLLFTCYDDSHNKLKNVRKTLEGLFDQDPYAPELVIKALSKPNEFGLQQHRYFLH